MEEALYPMLLGYSRACYELLLVGIVGVGGNVADEVVNLGSKFKQDGRDDIVILRLLRHYATSAELCFCLGKPYVRVRGRGKLHVDSKVSSDFAISFYRHFYTLFISQVKVTNVEDAWL